MSSPQLGFWGLTFKSIVAHTLTYFLLGLAALAVLNYSELYARPDAANCWAHSCGCAAPGLRS
ncbi:MAG TPA: hypothetical protein DCL15_08970 [Chloroflexi bacterium]|nr:hypothetical protein [Chloroflexota bacterium]HHW85497.1 hypothetical protein [Chloroflexota bacterium]